MTKSFIFVGPALFGGARQETVEFPWEQLDSSKPLIYVSMGTLYHQVKDGWVSVSGEMGEIGESGD
jgi:UDP:flavonoid glycosyltransferase YjiC (YdhE family)